MEERYFQWLCDQVRKTDDSETELSPGYFLDSEKYNELLKILSTVDYCFTQPMDANLEANGVDLRFQFGRAAGYSDPEIAYWLDIGQCSVLEMLVALSIHCERFMTNADFGDRTWFWFWSMIFTLGLETCSDGNIDAGMMDYILYRLNNWMKGDYLPDGYGGLFYIPDTEEDLRAMDTWHQMHRWLLRYFPE